MASDVASFDGSFSENGTISFNNTDYNSYFRVGMNKVYYLSFFVFLAIFLGYSTHDAHATTFVLNQTFCESNGGTWDSGTNTCTMSTLTINSGDILQLNSGTTLNVTSSLTISGNVTLNTGNIISSGTFSNSGNVTINAGSVTNSGTLTNNANAILNNNAGGTITNTATGTIDNSGSITNNPTSSIANAGSINNNSGGIINNNSASLNNSGSITNTGTINNNGATITNSGSFTNDSGGKITNNSNGQITNSGTMTNSGTIKNNSGTIHNSNTFTNTATGLISNPATVENDCNATFTDNGKITGNAVVQISCDTTPPVITPNISGTLGDNGWYTSDVTVNWSVTDSESLISSQSGCDPTTITTDTVGQTLTCTATSSGGTSSQSVTIMRDTVQPSTSIDSATDGNSVPVTDGGKTNSNSINVAFTATDTTSGVAGSTCNIDGGTFSACTSPVSYSSLADGSHTVQIRSTDSAGNQETTATFSWTVDTTKPTADPQSVSTNENTPLAITLTGSDSDGDSLTFAVGTGPSHGA
ncbi:MAG: hypothetical protein HY223_07145, partial [Thaumarchaeota archaeon]|nr:hypothetical protein [Nitrososphaerota archaeon]